MPSDKTVRVGAFVFSIFFAIVVALGYMPGINGQPHVHHPGMSMEPGEHMLMGLYRISLLDDVTHGLSAILFLVAALHSARASRLALTAFGWYYAYDAIIYLVTGVLQSKPLGENIGLNIPHVIISGIMLWLAYRVRTNVSSATTAVPA
jgi:Ca2+/Na+ antiporter